MITLIGITAGKIWEALERSGESSVQTIIKETGESRDIVLMAVGWLAREGYVLLEEIPDGYKIKFN